MAHKLSLVAEQETSEMMLESCLVYQWSYCVSLNTTLVQAVTLIFRSLPRSYSFPDHSKPRHVDHKLGIHNHEAIQAGSAFIKPDQRNPWIKDQIKITLLPTISPLLLPNFVSCGRACPSHMTQNLVTVGAKLWTADRFIVDPWSMDYADPVW